MSINNNNKPSYQATPIITNVPERVPRLFEDEEDYDPDSFEIITNDEIMSLNNEEHKIHYNPDKWMSPDVFISDNDLEYSITPVPDSPKKTNEIKIENEEVHVDISPTLSTNLIEPEFNNAISTKMSTVEILRRLNDDLNKEKKIEKLTKQNVILRKELRKLKQNVRRWEHRKQQKTITTKKSSLKKQKRAVLNIVNDMDIPPFAKAIISLQLHTRKAPYTQEEKNLARAFQQYSRADLTRLKTAGCNFPSRSSIKRWIANFDEAVTIDDPLAISSK